MILNRLMPAALLVFGSCAMSSHAATANTSFQVSMTIAKSCSVTATNMSFGTPVATATNISEATAGSVTVTCSKNTPYTVGLAPSAANGGTAGGTGSMSGTGGNTDKVPYGLYANAAHTTIWGDTAGTNTVAGTGTGS